MEDLEFSSILSAQISNLEKQKCLYEKKYQELDKDLLEKNMYILELENRLKIEMFKTNLFSKLISTYTELDLDKLYVEDEKGIHINLSENTDISVYVHDSLDKCTEYKLGKDTQKPKQKRQTFRNPRNIVELVEENPEEKQDRVLRIQKEREKIIQENFDVPCKETIQALEAKISEFSHKHVITGKTLRNIMKVRCKLIGKMPLPQYIKLLHSHIEQLRIILKRKKKNEKETLTKIEKMLTPLDQRLINFHRYFNTTLDTDHIHDLNLSLDVNMKYPNEFEPFNIEKIFESLHNYGMALSPLKKILGRVFSNPKGYNNLIYLDLPKSLKDDPFSFYRLEHTEKQMRKWKLEIRLYDLSVQIAQNIRGYCISLFRKIYNDVFSDNIYRPDYTNKAPIFSEDCEQILQNMMLASQQKSFCNFFREIIVEKCTMKMTKNDKCNFTADDRLQKKTFDQEKNDPEDMVRTTRQLFDEISTEDIDDFITPYQTFF